MSIWPFVIFKILSILSFVTSLFVWSWSNSIAFFFPQIGSIFNSSRNLSHKASLIFFWIEEVWPGFLNFASRSGLCWKRGKVSAENSRTLGGENGQFRDVVSRIRCSSSSWEVRVRIASGSLAKTPEPDARSMWSVSDLLPFEKWWAKTMAAPVSSEKSSIRLTISPTALASFSSIPVASL